MHIPMPKATSAPPAPPVHAEGRLPVKDHASYSMISHWKLPVKISLFGKAPDSARKSRLASSGTAGHRVAFSTYDDPLRTMTEKLANIKLEHPQISLPTLLPFSLAPPLSPQTHGSAKHPPPFSPSGSQIPYAGPDPLHHSSLPLPLSSLYSSPNHGIKRTAGPSSFLFSLSFTDSESASESDSEQDSSDSDFFNASLSTIVETSEPCSPKVVAIQDGLLYWPGTAPFSFADDSENPDVYFGDDEDECTDGEEGVVALTGDCFEWLHGADLERLFSENDERGIEELIEGFLPCVDWHGGCSFSTAFTNEDAPGQQSHTVACTDGDLSYDGDHEDQSDIDEGFLTAA